MKLFTSISFLVVSWILICLVGCHEKSTELSPSNKATVRAKEAKPGAAIKLTSSSIVTINANEPTRIELLLDVQESGRVVNIELSTTKGLEILNTQLRQRISLTESGPIKIPVELRAMINGRYYLNIHTGVDNNDLLSTRNLALIVQVGMEEAKSVQLKKASGENVIVLPAQETISDK